MAWKSEIGDSLNVKNPSFIIPLPEKLFCPLSCSNHKLVLFSLLKDEAFALGWAFLCQTLSRHENQSSKIPSPFISDMLDNFAVFVSQWRGVESWFLAMPFCYHLLRMRNKMGFFCNFTKSMSSIKKKPIRQRHFQHSDGRGALLTT